MGATVRVGAVSAAVVSVPAKARIGAVRGSVTAAPVAAAKARIGAVGGHLTSAPPAKVRLGMIGGSLHAASTYATVNVRTASGWSPGQLAAWSGSGWPSTAYKGWNGRAWGTLSAGGTPPSGTFTPGVADAGTLPVGTAHYTVPSGALFVDSSNGSDSNAGTVGAPFQTLRKACAAVAANGTIVMRAGSYHEGTMNGASNGVTLTHTGVTIQNYPGEAVWMEGTSIRTGWVSDTTAVPGRTVWRCDSWGINFDRSPTYSRGADDQTAVGWQMVNPAYPTAAWPDQIFIDDQPLQSVASLSQVATGTFFIAGTYTGGTSTPSQAGTAKYAYSGTSAYIGSDPTGHTVRATDLAVALATVADNCTVRGIGFRRYGPSVCDMGAVKIYRASNTIENCYIQQMSTGALAVELRANQVVRKVTIDTAGFTGMKNSSCDNILIDRLHVINANHANFNQAPAAAGMKMTGAQYPVIKNSIFEGGNCSAIWFDVSVLSPQVYSNNFLNNAGHGAICEISGGQGTSAAGTVYADNLVVNCGKIGIYVMDSDRVRMWCNTVINSGENNFDWNEDTRTPANTTYGRDGRQAYPAYYQSTMTWLPVYGEFSNNVSQAKPGALRGLFAIRGDSSLRRGFQNYGISSDGNIFSHPSAGSSLWVLVNNSGSGVSYSTFAAYQAASGTDVNSYDYTTAVLDGNYKLTGTAAPKTGRPLPADIAALIGQQAGSTHIGAFR